MDILLTLNDGIVINIEMQLNNYGNWQFRSVAYVCREYDNINRGEDYKKVLPVYHIGFIDFTLFENHPEFCATYQLRNAKDNFTVHTLRCSQQWDLPIPVAFGKGANPVFNALHILTLSAASAQS